MSKFRIEVLVKEGAGKAWRPIHPTNGPPYEYDTRQEAERVKRMCYGLDYDRQARIVEIHKGRLMQIINDDGLVVFEGMFTSRADCIKAYRAELGAEAIDYDGVNPHWADDLEVRTA